ncbi:MAG TPA: hypothetical protein PL117_01630 [Accumulibacter sp.]|uniref:hypothetical protein n=1 Tax=Accumulibacter sp. TaxID=2053492 RepID=UPI002C1B78CA|nr:hypothetical protein [Accumulibacter sp.]HRF71449.1 hypothetical protein [Accumulibacter sp.]
MKRLLLVAAALLSTTAPAIAADLGLSVSIGQPGFYGRIDVGGYPQPQLVYPQPILVERVPVGRPPVYLYVPPGHAKHWSKHCRSYGACGVPVHFVNANWYQREYVPRYQRTRHYRGNDLREDYRDYRRNGYGDPHSGDYRGDARHDPRGYDDGHRDRR